MCRKKVSSSATLVIIFFLNFMNLANQFAESRPIEVPMETRFEKWIAEFGRNYKDEAEKARRFVIFKAHADFVDSTNAIKGLTYTVGLNDFSDLTDEEFAPYSHGALVDEHERCNEDEKSSYCANMRGVTTNEDLMRKDLVTRVKRSRNMRLLRDLLKA